jgi:CRISPR/Cas system CSM-associated protein Csm2 small subunit
VDISGFMVAEKLVKIMKKIIKQIQVDDSKQVNMIEKLKIFLGSN